MTFHDELNSVLDDALAEYREVEPLAGLEDRVLQRVKSQAECGRRPWWRWNAVAAAAAVLAMAAWIGFSGSARHKVLPSPVAAQKQGLPSEPQWRAAGRAAAKEQVAEANRPRSPRAPAALRVASYEGEPRKEHFPLPAPLKPEERMLLALAQTHPEFLRELSRDDEDQEISIAPIHIKPLAEGTGDHGGEN